MNPIPKKLYESYRSELEGYRADSIDETVEETLSLYDTPYNANILIRDGNQLAGFLIIGESPNCHPDCDYFICQAYIKPEHRRKGLMTETLRKFIKEHPGTYCLDVLYGNVYARSFWFKFFKRAGYTDIDLPFIEHGVTGICESLYFKKRR